MKNSLWIVLLVIFLFGCKNGKRSAERNSDFEQLTNEKNQFYENLQNRRFNHNEAMGLADSYKKFIDKYPKDDELPVIMMELADISNNYLNNIKDAIKYYSRVIEDFSNISDLSFSNGMGSPTNPLGILTFTSTSADPYYFKTTGLSIDTDIYDLVKIRAKSAVGGGTVAQIYWWNEYGGPSAERRENFTITSDDAWYVYEIDLSEHSGWIGTCDGFRHDPVVVSGIDCEVDWIKIYEGGDGADWVQYSANWVLYIPS